MTNNKLINYNVAQRSEVDARIARMMDSRRELAAAAAEKRNNK